MTEIDDKSLLRCAIKKSLYTSERLVVYAAWLIVGGAIALCTVQLGYYILPLMSGTIDSLCKIVISALYSIPLLAYEIVAIPVAIITYSFLWCIERELTDDDWKSGYADAAAIVAVTVAAFAVTVAAAAVTVAAAAVVFAAAFAAAAVVFAAAFAAAAFVDYNGTTSSKVFRFVGAAYHHYKQERK